MFRFIRFHKTCQKDALKETPGTINISFIRLCAIYSGKKQIPGDDVNKDKITRYVGPILILAVLCFLCSCVDRFAEKPTLTLKEVSLTLHSMKELKALLTVEIRNPNSFALNFKSLEYQFALENREAGRGIYDEPFQVPPSSTRTVTIPLAIEFDDLGSCIKSFIRGKDIPYKIEGILRLKLLWGSLKIPFAKEGHIKP